MKPSAPLSFATAEQVWALLNQEVRPLRETTCTLGNSAGRVLAADVKSVDEFPPFDRSVMDGFAVRAADLGADATTLPCVGLSRAGEPLNGSLPFGFCAQINTGAVIPNGADAVIQVEHTRWVEGPGITPADPSRPIGRVELCGSVTVGVNIERRGSISHAGSTIVNARRRISAGELAAIAAAGVSSVRVFQQPYVALLTTGDELVDPVSIDAGSPAPLGQIIDSNRLLLTAATAQFGGKIEVVDRCADDASNLTQQLQRGLQCDVLVVAGGMSKGSHDLVPAALERLGVEWLVTSLNLKPGKPTRIGRTPTGAWVVGLPGNPVSCGVCFHLFVRPILEGLQGLPAGAPPLLAAELLAPLKAAGPRPMYHPARWTVSDEGRAGVAPLNWRGSGDPFGLAGANALLARGADDPARAAGEIVRILPLSTAR